MNDEKQRTMSGETRSKLGEAGGWWKDKQMAGTEPEGQGDKVTGKKLQAAQAQKEKEGGWRTGKGLQCVETGAMDLSGDWRLFKEKTRFNQGRLSTLTG